MQLKNKVALITGSSSGIGKGMAIEFAKEGANIIVNYNKRAKSANKVAKIINDLGRKAIVVGADISKKEDVDRLVNKGWEELGKIDILVNNSGISREVPFLKMKEEEWDKTLNINLKGAFLCSQAVAQRMVKNKIKGKIINISSVNGFQAEINHAHYNSSKGGLNALTQSLAAELGQYKINVNGIAVGVVPGTNIDPKFFGDKEIIEKMLSKIPIGRFGTVEDCAEVAVFLASSKSDYIHGETIVLDGGLTIIQY
jgi:NAD(P)-dependent dehydrogenase (short-subunit alcohol dehydrogenase family)